MVASAPLGTPFGDIKPGTAGVVSGPSEKFKRQSTCLHVCGLCVCVVCLVYVFGVAVWSTGKSGMNVVPALCGSR